VKTRRLPITDLARICVHPYDLQLSMLRQVKGGGQGPNYNPVRGQFAGIVNRQPGAFPSKRDPWPVVESNVKTACRTDDEWRMNLPVARQLYEYCVENQVRAVELEGYPMSFSFGPKILCWSPAVFIYKDRITIPFTDFRRGRSLHREAMRCIFSLQHYALRVNNPDYTDVSLEIFKFANNAERSLRAHAEDGRWLFSYDQLELMVTRTQRLWYIVLDERDDQARKQAAGKRGPLL
jgi:hypothetical protein